MAVHFAIFQGTDSAGDRGLWVTDGTAGRTYELTGIAGAYSVGLFGGPTSFAPDFTSFNREVLFSGLDANDHIGLWVTNGAAAGTYELTGISNANANGLFVGYFPAFTILNGEVLFNGVDAAGNYGLWETNGTATGTKEITGISGASPVGLFHGLNADLVVFNNKVLFAGLDASNQTELWVTDGTAAGTHELTGISGAFTGSGGLFGGPPTTHVASPPDLTIFNNEVLFNGLDAAGNNGLWTTDGTASGTRELTTISGANATGVDPFYLTPFKHEVIFNGDDAIGNRGLWVTDGTAAGTHEVTGIKNASAAGVNPSDLTVFKGEVVFNGIDGAGKNGLWVTNGTAAGTHEVTGIVGADPSGLNPSDLTVFKNVVLFDGYDSSGKTGLWVTNGTAAGTHELTVAGAYTGLVGPFSHPGGLLPLGLTSVTLPDLKGADTFNFAPDLGSSTSGNSNVHGDAIGLPNSQHADLAALVLEAHQTNTVTHDGHDGAALDHLAQSLSHAANFHLV